MPYTAVVLDEVSRNRVLKIVHEKVGIPGDWHVKAHHMTIETKSIDKTAVHDRADEIVEMLVTHIGTDSGIVAVRVTCDNVPSKNAIKHVTVAHMDGVKPVKSNDISDWAEISMFTIQGIIKEVA